MTRTRSKRRSRQLSQLTSPIFPLVACLTAAVYLRTLAPTITWRHHGADGGDLIAAAATLGISHPTGYPTYILLGRLFLLIPWGDAAHRLHLMSAFFAALTVLVLCLIVQRSFLRFGDGGSAPHISVLVAASSGLAFAFSPLFWSQALIAEVYSLNAFFVALTLYLLLSYVETPKRELLILLTFTYGLGLGNHLTLLLLTLATPLMLVTSDPGVRLLEHLHAPSLIRGLASVIIPLLLGLSVYLYLPIRAAQNPPINWGTSHTWQGFYWMVSGSLYRRFLFALPVAYLSTRLSAWVGLLAQQFHWGGTLLGLVGLWAMWQKGRRLALLSSSLFLTYSVYSIGYNTTDSHIYLIPAFLLFAIWLGWGLNYLLVGLHWLTINSGLWLRIIIPICLTLAIPLTSLVTNFSSLDLSRDRTAGDYGLQALATLAPQAILISQTDPHTFTLWYFHHAEERRPDVAILDGTLLHYEWYRYNVGHLYPHISLDAEGAPLTSLTITLIKGNLSRYPVYLTDPDPQVQAHYQLSKEGPVYRVIAQSGD